MQYQLDYLDTIVENTVDFFAKQKHISELSPENFHFPLILGSGNAIETGKILFRNNPAMFASESDAPEKIKISRIQEVVVISASGSKHAPMLVDLAREAGKVTHLISSTSDSDAAKRADFHYIYPKISEPYTYNTSTYFGYFYGAEQKNYKLSDVKNFIDQKLKTIISKVNFSDYDAFFVVLPNEFSLLKNMVEMKFIELFGRKIARDVATYEQVKHAMTVVPNDRELFLAFGNEEGKKFGKNQIDLPLFDRENYGPMMLAAYWTVGKIQRSQPNYFMENIADYCQKSEYNISPIVEA